MPCLRLSCLGFVFLATTLFAQNAPKGEVFGGYQYLRLSDGISPSRLNSNGWNAGVSYYFSRWMGIKADFSGAYATDSTAASLPFNVRNYTYTFGPVFSAGAHGRFTPFGEVLFGKYHETLSGFPSSDDGFAMLAGGGVDVSLSPHFSWRAVQADWLYTHPPSPAILLKSNNVRIVTGIVVHF